MGAAQVVQPDDRDAGAAGDPLERLGQGVGVDGLAVAVGEDPAAIMLETDGGEGGALELLPPGEQVEGDAVEVDVPTGGAGLAAGRVHVVADGDEAAV